MKLSLARALALGVVVSFGTAAYAEPPGDPKAVKSEDGKYLDAQGDPTYNVKDGTVDWYTFSGYRRYHSECHVCHGPNGAGSTYAPALKELGQALQLCRVRRHRDRRPAERQQRDAVLRGQ